MSPKTSTGDTTQQATAGLAAITADTDVPVQTTVDIPIKAAGFLIEQVAPYGVIGLLCLWLVLQALGHRRTIVSHNGTVSKLVSLVGEALKAIPPEQHQ